MTEYKLGPNGAIVTALNLFATQFGRTRTTILEKRKNDYEHIIVDTPGQIEAFTWSASGQLIAESSPRYFRHKCGYRGGHAAASSTTWPSLLLLPARRRPLSTTA